MYSPCEKSPTKTHRFCVLSPLKNHPSKPIGFMYSPLWKITHQTPSVLCTLPFEKSPIKTHRFLCTPPFGKSPTKPHRFYVLSPLKNHPSKPIGFMYSPLWKITHQTPSVLCTPPPPLKNHPSKLIGFAYSPLWKLTVFDGRLFSGWAFFRQIWYIRRLNFGSWRVPI